MTVAGLDRPPLVVGHLFGHVVCSLAGFLFGDGDGLPVTEVVDKLPDTGSNVVKSALAIALLPFLYANVWVPRMSSVYPDQVFPGSA